MKSPVAKHMNKFNKSFVFEDKKYLHTSKKKRKDSVREELKLIGL